MGDSEENDIASFGVLFVGGVELLLSRFSEPI